MPARARTLLCHSERWPSESRNCGSPGNSRACPANRPARADSSVLDIPPGTDWSYASGSPASYERYCCMAASIVPWLLTKTSGPDPDEPDSADGVSAAADSPTSSASSSRTSSPSFPSAGVSSVSCSDAETSCSVSGEDAPSEVTSGDDSPSGPPKPDSTCSRGRSASSPRGTLPTCSSPSTCTDQPEPLTTVRLTGTRDAVGSGPPYAPTTRGRRGGKRFV